MEISNKSLITNIALFIGYIIVSFITYSVVGNFLHVFLIWNLFLAAIPFALVFLIDRKLIRSKVAVIITLLLWLFFFPNSVYIITDLIYLDVNEFIGASGLYEPTNYLQVLSPYLALFHIYLGSFIGLLYGFKSLYALYNMSQKTILRNYRDYLVVIVFVLSGVAIYIGRFFRYNSWEIFKVFDILKDFFSSFSGFTIFFVLALALIQCIIFYGIKYNLTENKTLN